MAIPDDRELDDWFEEQKELLSQRLADELDAGKDWGVARGKFDLGFAKLLDEYDTRYKSADKAWSRHEQLAKPFRAVAAWWHDHATAHELAKKRRRELRKKKTFERKYRKLFPSTKKKI